MSQSFDKQIFGQTVEVIRPQTPSLSTIKPNPSSTFMSSSIHSEQNYSNSSLKAEKHPEEKRYKNLPDAQTNYTDNGSVRKSGGEVKGLRKNRAIENSNAVQEKSIRQVNIKKLSPSDNFYCMCCQGEQKKQNCIACQGAGSADGTNNIVKFIEYIMQFKLGIKQSYKNHKSNLKIEVNRSQEEEPTNYSRESINTTKQVPNYQEKKVKRNINLSNKNPVALTTTNLTFNQSTRINGFCTDYIKSLPFGQAAQEGKEQKESSVYNPSEQRLKLTKSTYQSNSGLSYNNKSLIFNEENVSSINVGIKGMAESIIDDSLNERPVKYEFSESRKSLGEHEGIGQYYGYQSLSNTVKQPASSSVLLINNNKKNPNICLNRLSIPEKQTLTLSEMKQKFSLQNTIHCGYSCDKCQVEPIRGTRYHCTSFMCEDDYDLCQDCYKEYGHKHNMVEIRGNNLDKICEELQQRSSKSINHSTRMSLGAFRYGRDQEAEDEKLCYNNLIFKSSIH